MEIDSITGILIAGDKRSGSTSSSQVEMKEEIMIRTIHNLTSIYCPEIIFSTDYPERYPYIDATFVPDEIGDIGPIEAILSCLKKSRTSKNLVISCKMPMVPAGLLHLLIEKREDAEFVVPASGNEIEPLCAVYDKSLIPVLSQMISEGDHNLENLQFHCATEYIQVYNGNDIFKHKKQLVESRSRKS